MDENWYSELMIENQSNFRFNTFELCNLPVEFIRLYILQYGFFLGIAHLNELTHGNSMWPIF